MRGYLVDPDSFSMCMVTVQSRKFKIEKRCYISKDRRFVIEDISPEALGSLRHSKDGERFFEEYRDAYSFLMDRIEYERKKVADARQVWFGYFELPGFLKFEG